MTARTKPAISFVFFSTSCKVFALRQRRLFSGLLITEPHALRKLSPKDTEEMFLGKLMRCGNTGLILHSHTVPAPWYTFKGSFCSVFSLLFLETMCFWWPLCWLPSSSCRGCSGLCIQIAARAQLCLPQEYFHIFLRFSPFCACPFVCPPRVHADACHYSVFPAGFLHMWWRGLFFMYCCASSVSVKAVCMCVSAGEAV